MNAYETVLNHARQLSSDEQLLLLTELATLVRQQITIKEEPRQSFLELAGSGKENWRDIDVEKYINEERDSWNG